MKKLTTIIFALLVGTWGLTATPSSDPLKKMNQMLDASENKVNEVSKKEKRRSFALVALLADPQEGDDLKGVRENLKDDLKTALKYPAFLKQLLTDLSEMRNGSNYYQFELDEIEKKIRKNLYGWEDYAESIERNIGLINSGLKDSEEADLKIEVQQ